MLQVDDNLVKHFLLKFDVAGVNGQTVTNAKLCLYNTDGANAGGDFHHVSDDSWQEETVTWTNAPTADTQVLASLGAVSPNTWVEVDLTAHVTGDGTYSLRISDSVGGADYSSKEGTNDPKLLVAVAGATPQSRSGTATATPSQTPAVTNTPTRTPTAGPSPTPTKTSTPTVAPTATATPSQTATQPPPPAAFSSAAFVYDGDGRRVESTFNNTTTTYFVGAHYEVTDGVITKYYYAGSQRIAMRTDGTLNYLLGDHLGSTSLTTDASGQIVSELRYKAWGETRYSSGTTPTKYTYTGQYSNMSDFGLMFYNARWYDPALGRFVQADSIIPQNQGIQAWDRYAYTNNNPVRYTDPTGHSLCQILVSFLGASSSCPSSEGNWIEGFDRAPDDIGLEIHVPVSDDNNLEGFDPAPEGQGALINVPVQQDDEVEGFDPVPDDGTLGVIADTEDDDNASLINQLEKSLNSFQERLTEHEEKLQNYINNPDAYDNRGFLKNAPNQEIRESIIQGRIDHLQGEINNFQNQIDELRRMLKGLT